MTEILDLVSKPEINQGKNVYVLQYVQHRLKMEKIMKTGYLQNAPQTHLNKSKNKLLQCLKRSAQST